MIIAHEARLERMKKKQLSESTASAFIAQVVPSVPTPQQSQTSSQWSQPPPSTTAPPPAPPPSVWTPPTGATSDAQTKDASERNDGGYTGSYGRGRGRGRSNLQCSYCNKFGHDLASCWSKPASIPNSPSNSIPGYLNSGILSSGSNLGFPATQFGAFGSYPNLGIPGSQIGGFGPYTAMGASMSGIVPQWPQPWCAPSPIGMPSSPGSWNHHVATSSGFPISWFQTFRLQSTCFTSSITTYTKATSCIISRITWSCSTGHVGYCSSTSTFNFGIFCAVVPRFRCNSPCDQQFSSSCG